MNIALVLWGVLMGMMLPMQAGANAAVAKASGHPVYAALWNFLSGSVLLFALAAWIRFAAPARPLGAHTAPAHWWTAVPWWAWIGGVLGTLFVASSAFLAPRIGAVLLALALLAGQLIASGAIDRLGLLGFAPRPLSPLRTVGIALVVVGVALVFLGTRPANASAATNAPAALTPPPADPSR